ncbi:MAG: hypothetical protein LH645_10170 [Actinomycetia bacterium]|nr:hypothetical protein [Actinomycetes bacterium]
MARPRLFEINAIHDAATTQGGTVSHAQLVDLGVSKATISSWTRTGGRWQRVLPGTYLLHRGTPTVDERLSAGLLYAGPDAVLTGGLAAHLLGLRNLPMPVDALPVHILVPPARQVRSAGFVVIERTQRLPEPETIRGYPVAPLPRAVFDVGRRHTSRIAIRAITLEAVQRKMLEIDDLAEEIRSGQRQWTAVMRDVLGDAIAGVRSVPEAGLRDIVIASDLPEPLWNCQLETLGGEFIAEPDGYYEDIGLALEVDSREHHYKRVDNFAATWSRHGVYNRHRVLAERILPETIRDDPDSVISAIRATRVANTGRVQPNVRVVMPAMGSAQGLPRPGR